MYRTTICIALLITAPLFAFDNGRTPVNTVESGERMINDLITTFGGKYPKGQEYLDRLKAADSKDTAAIIREAALANPLLQFDKILIVRRKTAGIGYGFIGLNSHTIESARRTGWDNELSLITGFYNNGEVKIVPIHRPPNTYSLRELDLYWDGSKIMFSSLERQQFNGKDEDRWGVFELGINEQGELKADTLRKLTPFQHDVDWFDSCYLPEDGAFITGSTAGMQGLPCENGGRPMVNMYRVDIKTGIQDKAKIRQLTFEQDSDWNVSVREDGSVMYLRWEYSDIPHYTSRILFTMQPDGQKQRAIWGSGSLFPTAYKSPRQIPGSSEIIGVASGHHISGGDPEVGRLVIFNPSLGTKYPFRYDPASKEWGPQGSHINIFPRVYPKEVTGVMQEIPGWGKDVVGNVYDNQGGAGTYRFCFPYPLNENYFLVSMRRHNEHEFGLYLVDRFDNITEIMKIPQNSLFHPLPLQARKKPPVKPDATVEGNKTGTIFITDIYHGAGLKGVPRGTVKQLRIFAYHFGFRRSGGHESVGQHSSWDIKRILGTVPVEDDGSASFIVPSNTPIAMQPLDAKGQAIQLMRSWTVAMPGEQQSCTGCHESPLDVTPTKRVKAGNRPPSKIKDWYGPERAFGYDAEIQPMLNAKCVSCHNNTNKAAKAGFPSFEYSPNSNEPDKDLWAPGPWTRSISYNALNPYVWRPGPEPQLDMLHPMEYHASNSELIQRLDRGHYGANLSKEDWDRLYTWIDLNAPYRGLWMNPSQESRRLELSKLYANIDTNPEEEYRAALAAAAENAKVTPVRMLSPESLEQVVQQFTVADNLKAMNFPFDAAAAKKLQCGNSAEVPVLKINLPEVKRDAHYKPGDTSLAWIPGGGGGNRFAAPAEQRFALSDNRSMTFVKIPAGEFVMGQLDGLPDEQQRKVVKVAKAFWIAETEITNGQYGIYDPEHDSLYIDEDGKDHVVPGYIANHPDQPVVRVSFEEAEKFCEWLSKQSGRKVQLPTEAQWEWAARAGTETPFWFGDRQADWSKYANLSGKEVQVTRTQWESGSTLHVRRSFADNSAYPLRDNRFSDQWFVSDYVKQYEPNPWGLYDIIGNVWEWTVPADAAVAGQRIVAKGGSWRDRPVFAGSSAKVYFERWQKVMNVGFRPVIIEE